MASDGQSTTDMSPRARPDKCEATFSNGKKQTLSLFRRQGVKRAQRPHSSRDGATCKRATANKQWSTTNMRLRMAQADEENAVLQREVENATARWMLLDQQLQLIQQHDVVRQIEGICLRQSITALHQSMEADTLYKADAFPSSPSQSEVPEGSTF